MQYYKINGYKDITTVIRGDTFTYLTLALSSNYSS